MNADNSGFEFAKGEFNFVKSLILFLNIQVILRLLRFLNFFVGEYVLCVCVMCVCTHTHASTHVGMVTYAHMKRMSELLELELQEVLNDQTWVLRSELQSSGKVASVPNHRALSSASSPILKTGLGGRTFPFSLNKWKLDTILKRKIQVFIFKIGNLRLSPESSREKSNRLGSLKVSVTAVRRSTKGRIRVTNKYLNQKEKKLTLT